MYEFAKYLSLEYCLLSKLKRILFMKMHGLNISAETISSTILPMNMHKITKQILANLHEKYLTMDQKALSKFQ